MQVFASTDITMKMLYDDYIGSDPVVIPRGTRGVTNDTIKLDGEIYFVTFETGMECFVLKDWVALTQGDERNNDTLYITFHGDLALTPLFLNDWKHVIRAYIGSNGAISGIHDISNGFKFDLLERSYETIAVVAKRIAEVMRIISPYFKNEMGMSLIQTNVLASMERLFVVEYIFSNAEHGNSVFEIKIAYDKEFVDD